VMDVIHTWVILLKLAHSWTEQIFKIDFAIDKIVPTDHVV
jgi:hypothetical protein